MAVTDIGRAMVIRELTRYWHAANSNSSATPYRKLYQAALIDLEAPIPTGRSMPGPSQQRSWTSWEATTRTN